eukprot:1294232-Pyramimonas_sp.AAC.1
MNDNILTLESWALQWYCQMGLRGTGFAFFDVRAAFPRLLHAMIWWVLGAMGLPTSIVDAVRKLYHRVWVSINFCGLQEA